MTATTYKTEAQPLLWKMIPFPGALLGLHIVHTQELLLFVASGLIAVLLVSYLVARVSASWLRVKVFWPETAHAGTSRTVRLVVTNIGWLPSVPFAVGAEVPGTAKAATERAGVLASSEGVEVEVALAFERRGVFTEAVVELATSVLGFVTVRGRTTLPLNLIVHPRVWVLTERNLGPGSPFSSQGLGNLPRAGHDVEFLGVREYAVGDSPRLIHWRTTARRGKLFVKEFARSSRADVTLFLDLGAKGPWTADLTDVLVTATASIVHLFRDLHLRYQLVGSGEPVHVRFAQGTSQYLHAMTVLTQAAPGGAIDAVSGLQAVADTITKPNALIVLSAFPTKEFLDTLEAISIRGVPIALLTPWLRNLPVDALEHGPVWEPVGPGGRQLRFPVLRFSGPDELKDILAGLK